ncbi:MAG: 7-carboxy-7-deazaguanine synthase [Planctomycetota bacterium]|nr:MAG: 7-carboxy-7-deazaguanine synthase [Planctomycetota bacterium]
MRISEIFFSIQGEGKLFGIPSAFIRTTGCNLRCTWCDTPYASWTPEGEDMTIDAILDRIAPYPTRFVVLTGGEPLLQNDVVELTRRLRDDGRHITIETAATVYKPVMCDLASLSPKLANSTPLARDGGKFAEAHERDRFQPDVIEAFIRTAPDFQLKFVVEREQDLEEIDRMLQRLPDVPRENVLLMPEGTEAASLLERGRWVAETCKSRGFRYCPRLHVELFGCCRGV